MRATIIILALSVALATAATTVCGQESPAPGSAPAKPDEQVVDKSLRSRIFELKHRDPNALVGVLRPLGSGAKGTSISPNHEFKTVSVRDYPENIGVIEEAIKRLDMPEAARPGIEFRVHILIATSGSGGGGNAAAGQYPADLNDVIKQLQSTLNYKNYHLMTSQVLRAKAGLQGVNNKGVAELKLSADTAASNNPIFYDYHIDRISLDPAGATAGGAARVQIDNFRFNMSIPLSTAGGLQYNSIGFSTPVSVREGERVVVGTTSMQDKGLVIVLSANVLK